MPKDKISQYAFTPAANTDIGGINIDEGCAPSGINNAIRTLMTQIRDLQAGVSGDTVPLTAGGTGSGTAASARAALGLAIGTNVLGYVTPGTSGNVLQSDGTNWTSVAQGAAVTLDTITGGPLAVAKGGTGATALASGSVLVGNGTSTVNLVASGATGQVLTSTGTGWVSQAAGGGQFQTEIFTAPGTWTKPASCTQVRVTVVGGGGGGGSVSPARRGGAGGFTQAIVSVTAPVAITVGSGGDGAIVPAATAGSGGTSSFGSLVSVTGGTGATPATPGIGTPGTGTVPVGTVLRNSVGGVNGTILTAGTLSSSPAPTSAAIAFSTTGNFAAGSPGGSSGSPSTGLGGVGGAILVEFVG